MRKKRTLEEVRKSFESEGYTLLTTNYKNNRQKLDYICPKRHKHSISWDNWRLGQRCGICFGSKKLSIEKVKGSFAKENYTLLSDKYENNFKKLKFRCPKGHEHSITWNDWQS